MKVIASKIKGASKRDINPRVHQWSNGNATDK